MSMFKRYQSDDDFTDEEKRLLAEAESAAQKRASQGSMIGSLLGGVAGGAASIFSGGSLALPAISGGAALGGSIGAGIGGLIGGGEAEAAEKRAALLREQRMRPLLDRQRRLSLVGEYLGQYLPRGM